MATKNTSKKLSYNSYIVRFSEIALKGNTRSRFERKLMDNIRDQVGKDNYQKISRPRGRLIIDTEKNLDLTNIFGISSFSRAIRVDFSKDNIRKAIDLIIEKLSLEKYRSFRVNCQRLNKQIRTNSMEIEKEMGAYIQEKTGYAVSLKEPDIIFTIELIDESAFVTIDKNFGHAGLPTGIEGKVFVLFEEVEDFLAAWYMMKRGCDVIGLYIQDEFKTKFKKELKNLDEYSPKKIEYKRIKDLSEIKALAQKYKITSIISGVRLGQRKKRQIGITNMIHDLVHLMPLIIFDEKDISNELREKGFTG